MYLYYWYSHKPALRQYKFHLFKDTSKPLNQETVSETQATNISYQSRVLLTSSFLSLLKGNFAASIIQHNVALFINDTTGLYIYGVDITEKCCN